MFGGNPTVLPQSSQRDFAADGDKKYNAPHIAGRFFFSKIYLPIAARESSRANGVRDDGDDGVGDGHNKHPDNPPQHVFSAFFRSFPFYVKRIEVLDDPPDKHQERRAKDKSQDRVYDHPDKRVCQLFYRHGLAHLRYERRYDRLLGRARDTKGALGEADNAPDGHHHEEA